MGSEDPKYFDGKDYGPWAKKEATVIGPAQAKLEEKLLRQSCVGDKSWRRQL
jgi:hypothetical protein